MGTKRSKLRRKPPAASPSAKVNAQKSAARSLETVVGPEVYQTWVDMLRVLVPEGRTHRLAPLLAAMLQYAASVAGDVQDDETDAHSLVQSLRESTQVFDLSEVKALLHDAVSRLFHDARVDFKRVSVRGYSYSIADDAYSEYIHWFDMPWN